MGTGLRAESSTYSREFWMPVPMGIVAATGAAAAASLLLLLLVAAAGGSYSQAVMPERERVAEKAQCVCADVCVQMCVQTI